MLVGQKLTVLPTAVESLSKFKPGDQMTLLLTEDGQVAGAVEASGTTARSNAVGIVRGGKVQLLCGTAKIEVSSDKAGEYEGQLVRVSSTKSGIALSRLTGGVSGDLNVDAKKLGGKALADSVMIFENGKETTLSQLTSGVIHANEIAYARTNWAGKVDLIVLGSTNGDTVYYGRAVVHQDADSQVWVPDEGGGEGAGHYETQSGKRSLEVQYGAGKSVGPYETGYAVNTGDYVAATVKNGRFTAVYRLTELRNVSNSAWNGSTAVTVGGQTYRVSAGVLCYNKDTGKWLTLSEAHAYASASNLYVKDGVVRVIEVKHG